MKYIVYMLLSRHNNKIYTYVGFTNNLKKRIYKHNVSKGAKYTRGKKWNIIYKKNYLTKSNAMKEEYKLKKNRKLRILYKTKYLNKFNA
tara:strand:+ start:478 stop:744 length:267 start_codon:yes stop_codon:yes gene_type:complete